MSTNVRTKKSLIIVGGGGFAREVIWLAKEIPDEWEITGILDDSIHLQDRVLNGIPVIGKISDWKNHYNSWFVVAIGSPRTRKAVVKCMEQAGPPRFATLLHPSMLHSQSVSFQDGCIITAGCILTAEITVGRHVIVNLGVTVGHNVSIGDFCTVAPQTSISGNVSLGEGVEIGTGAILVPGVTVGTGSMVAAGSVVTKSVQENMFCGGYPSRTVKQLAPF